MDLPDDFPGDLPVELRIPGPIVYRVFRETGPHRGARFLKCPIFTGPGARFSKDPVS